MATLSDLIERVQDELDLQDEDFITPSEITTYLNAGVRSAGNIILNLYEDYFLASYSVTLVSGTAYYSLPSGIWGNKIRKILYNNGSKKRIISRIKDLQETVLIESSDDYKYLITNDATNGVRLYLYPTPAESGSYVSLWHIRKPKTLSDLADVMDIPEGEDYVVQYAKDKCKNKELGQPDAPPSAALLNEQELLMGGLSTRFPDDDNDIEPDLGFYQEHS